MSKTLYLHCGLPKTGTTFIQKDLFPVLPEATITTMVKPENRIFKHSNPWVGILEEAFNKSPYVWNDLGECIFNELFGEGEHCQSMNTLISEESVCLSQQPLQFEEHVKQFRYLARRWGFDGLRLLVSVRRQADVFASRYAQDSARRSGASQSDFERWLEGLITMDTTYLRNNYHGRGISRNYNLLWDAMASAVGEENVLMIPYELMKNDLSEFFGSWLSFMDIGETKNSILKKVKKVDIKKRNKRSTCKNTWQIRERANMGLATLNLRPSRLFQYIGLPTKVSLRWPDLDRENEIRLTSELRRRVMSFYEKSNENLDKKIDFDLEKHNYY
jgi:hypothetical protein